ncbi:MAG: 6-bladed beta-propeller [Clostridia bacterium]|nr:6-bladed beta-propeller [Clostridia bacterium]
MNKKRLYSLVGVLVVVIGIFFGYYYYKNLNPLDMLNDVPIGNVINPPEFKNFIFGGENNPLVLPLGVAINSGEVYVSDSDRGQVEVFDYNGKLLRVIGDKGPGRLNHPYGLAFNGNELYVADGGWGKILIFEPNGTFKRYFEPKDGVFFSAPSQLVIRDGKIIFPDLALSKVFVFDLDGNLLMTFGQRGEGRGQMIKPHGVAVDDEGSYYVADSNNNRVLKFNKDGKFVKYLAETADGKPGEILTPRGVAVDSRNNIYVVSGLGATVYVFNKEGQGLLNFNQLNDEEGNLVLPSGIAIDDNNKIFVTETTANRVSVFQ